MIASIIPLISAMSYDELKDWIDYVEYHYFSKLVPDKERDKFLKLIRKRRIGIPTGAFSHDGYLPMKQLTMTTENQNEALKEYKTLSKNEAILLLGKPSLKRKLAESIAWQLLSSKAPVRKQSQGNIQVKFIPYEYVEKDEKGQPMKDEDGLPIITKVQAPYLYLRYWQVHGDNSKTKRRYKNVYIGGSAEFAERIANFYPNSEGYSYPFRALAELFYNTIQEHGETRKRTIKTTGEIQSYKVRPKNDDNPIAALERRIMACVDMDTIEAIGKDAIDHEKLLELQFELCPNMP